VIVIDFDNLIAGAELVIEADPDNLIAGTEVAGSEVDFDNLIAEVEAASEVDFDNLIAAFVIDSCFALDFDIEDYFVFGEFVIVPESGSLELVAGCMAEFVDYFANYMAVVVFERIYH
jgi:hypothetical protein